MMKIHSRHTHRQNITATDSKVSKSASIKRGFTQHLSSAIKSGDLKLLDRIKDRIRGEGIKGNEPVSRIIVEEILKDVIKVKLTDKQFQKLIDRVSETVREDPLLSGYIKGLARKIE